MKQKSTYVGIDLAKTSIRCRGPGRKAAPGGCHTMRPVSRNWFPDWKP